MLRFAFYAHWKASGCVMVSEASGLFPLNVALIDVHDKNDYEQYGATDIIIKTSKVTWVSP